MKKQDKEEDNVPSTKKAEEETQDPSTSHREQVPRKHPHGESGKANEQVPRKHPHDYTTPVDKKKTPTRRKNSPFRDD